MLKKYAELIEIKKSRLGHTRFSVAIPTYIRPETLSNTIKSAMSQQYQEEFKIIVVDNNSERNDDTEMLMKAIDDPRISYYKNSKNVGMINNWNQCILAADSEWVVLVHDDDLLTEECLCNISESIEEYPEVDAILANFVQKGNPYTNKRVRNKKSRLKSCFDTIMHRLLKRDRPIAANLFCDNIYGPPTCGLALRRDAVIDFGGYSDRCIAADWDFMAHFSRTHRIVQCTKQTGVYLWAVNASMKESTMERIRKDRIMIIKDIIEYSTISRLYYRLLKKDFEKKFAAKTTEQVTYSVAYRLLKMYYTARI